MQAHGAPRVHFKGDTKGEGSSESEGEQAPGSEASFSTGGKPRRKLDIKIKDSAEVPSPPSEGRGYDDDAKDCVGLVMRAGSETRLP